MRHSSHNLTRIQVCEQLHKNCKHGLASTSVLFSSCIPQAKVPQKPYNKSFIDQVCSVKMARYWPRSFLESLWTSTSSRFISAQKNNLANIQTMRVKLSCAASFVNELQVIVALFRFTLSRTINQRKFISINF